MSTLKELPDQYAEIHAVAEDLHQAAEKLEREGYEAGDLHQLAKRLDHWCDANSVVNEYDDLER